MIKCTACKNAKNLYVIDREEAFQPLHPFSGYVLCFKPSYKRPYFRRDTIKECEEYKERKHPGQRKELL